MIRMNSKNDKSFRSLRVSLFAFYVLFSVCCFGQKTYTANYANNGLPTTACPVFNLVPPRTFGGLEHYLASGGVKATANAITMPSKTSGSVKYGSAYAIKLAVRKGYTYSISVSASSSDVSVPYFMRVSWMGDRGDPSSTKALDCSSVPETALSYWVQGTIDQKYISSAAQTSYSFGGTAPADLNYIVIEVYGGASSELLTSISSVTINENISLNVTSSSSGIACGATTPVTFTVNNPNTAGLITSYNWNLGTTPNGWLLPGGGAAPATYSTGTTNTLTLTPACGKALSSITASVTANGGNNYNAGNAVAVATTPPALGISGDAYLCSGSKPYNITGVPCNSVIAWTAPAAANGSLNPLNNASTTLTYGGTPANITLAANVTACGVVNPVTKPVHVGGYTNDDYTISWNNGTPPYYCLNQTITFTVGGGVVGTNYSWTYPAGWSLIYNSGSNVLVLKTPTSTGYPPTGSVSVTFTDPCGGTRNRSFQTVYSSAYCGSSSSPYTISPNPASSTITIACASLQTYCNISSVQITDLYGNVKSSQSFGGTNQQVQMPVSFLTNGTYIAKIYDGSQWYSNQFIVQH